MAKVVHAYFISTVAKVQASSILSDGSRKTGYTSTNRALTNGDRDVAPCPCCIRRCHARAGCAVIMEGSLIVKLVNMPFADWHRPSFALSQLESVIKERLGDRVLVETHYLNQDVADFLGAALYESIALSNEHVDSGLGEWLFRSIAFPDAEDNIDEYLRRFYHGNRWSDFRDLVRQLRPSLAGLMEDLIARHRLDHSDVVGLTSMFAQNVPSIALARSLKALNPRVLTVLGGANCEAPMGNVLARRVSTLDYIFSGPALITFPRFLEMILDGEIAGVGEIPGVLCAENASDPRSRAMLGSERPINQLVRPTYDGFIAAIDAHAKLCESSSAEPVLLFETSRGCWWGERSHCTFCGLNGNNMDFREMHAEAAVDQFKWLFALAPAYKSFYCTDNVMPRSYPREVFDQLDPPGEVSIYYEVKLPLSRADLARMARARVTMVQPGIEALASGTLRLMGKGTTAFQNIQFLKNAREFKIFPDWNLLLGFPGESSSGVRQISERSSKSVPSPTAVQFLYGAV
jgi:ribosomal peptide maturation radical SAM protein 1